MKIAYFVHDLNDPAVHRRMRMLQRGGADVALIGFCRGAAPARVEGCVPTVLGRTHDARLLHRVLVTARAAIGVGRLAKAVAGADVVIARQLEMLLVGERARRRHAPTATLVFECLDIHRLMLSRRLPGRVMRLIEGSLLARCSLLVVSSQGFVREHFEKSYRSVPPVLLVENKVLAFEYDPPVPAAAGLPAGPPWRIGWFGNIRCRRSLLLLAGLTRRFPGGVEVVIRGRPALTAIPDFREIVEAHPGISFKGPYDRRMDLASIYGDVHYVWAMDFFEAGGNSEWLLPNRLYEGSLFGAVALAYGPVETGRWLRSHRAGVIFEEPLAAGLEDFFAGVDGDAYRSARSAVARIPIDALVDGEIDCVALVDALCAPV